MRIKEFRENSSLIQIGFFRHHEKTMNLKPGTCFYKGIIEHELLHVLGEKFLVLISLKHGIFLGFVHEQARPDRDSYITVHFENIEPDQVNSLVDL